MTLLSSIGWRLRWLVFPGLNLHARLRHARLPAHFGAAGAGATRRVLDAGCGNGMLAHQSYLKGNQVTAISIKAGEIAGCRALFNGYLGLPETRLSFRRENLYDLAPPPGSLDEIICAEVLEHLVRDGDVCAAFHAALKPGGVLHITTPNAEHPYNRVQPLDRHEAGGHVRPGYDPAAYRQLLEPLGFVIETVEPLGGPVRQAFNAGIKALQERFGKLAGIPLFLLALLALGFESRAAEVRRPLAWYVRARKPAGWQVGVDA